MGLLLSAGIPVAAAESQTGQPTSPVQSQSYNHVLSTFFLLLESQDTNVLEQAVAQSAVPVVKKSGNKDKGSKETETKEKLHEGPECEAIVVVERFLEMPPERLTTIRMLIERIEQMSPEEREAMRERISNYRQLPDERRVRMMEEFHRIPIENRLLLRMYWRSLPPEVAQAEREKLKQMTADEQVAYREELIAKARAAGINICPPPPPPQEVVIPPPPPN